MAWPEQSGMGWDACDETRDVDEYGSNFQQYCGRIQLGLKIPYQTCWDKLDFLSPSRLL
jgi:hypothetical protein